MRKRSKEPRVTHHAITRYVQRVRGIVVPGDEAAVGAEALAEQHCAAAATTPDQIRAEILCPEVRLALKLGATGVRTSTFFAALNPTNRVVVTITVPDRSSPEFRLRNYSRKEGRREAHPRLRRRRGVPA